MSTTTRLVPSTGGCTREGFSSCQLATGYRGTLITDVGRGELPVLACAYFMAANAWRISGLHILRAASRGYDTSALPAATEQCSRRRRHARALRQQPPQHKGMVIADR